MPLAWLEGRRRTSCHASKYEQASRPRGTHEARGGVSPSLVLGTPPFFEGVSAAVMSALALAGLLVLDSQLRSVDGLGRSANFMMEDPLLR